MEELYLQTYTKPDAEEWCSVPLETLIVLFGFKYCNNPNVKITLVYSVKQAPAFKVNIKDFDVKFCNGQAIPPPADLCALPVFISSDKTTCIAGLCAVIRQIFKTADPYHPLLGFKQSCLYACAEASLWTRFCEIDALNMAKADIDFQKPSIPLDLMRFEVHMAQPVRIHNVMKLCQSMPQTAEGRPQSAADIQHKYAEGASLSIADLIIFASFHIVLSQIAHPSLERILPLTTQWYRLMLEETKYSLDVLGPIKPEFDSNSEVNFTVPVVPATSLYKSDPKRYKPRHRIYTRQEDVEESIEAVSGIELDMIDRMPFGADVPFDWESVPWDAQPAGGELPEGRILRKGQQLEAMARAVLKVAQNGDRLVDFCAGSGHLGLILAHSLPRCTVVLLENKQESLSRARQRAKKLQLNNILFCQSNVDYFTGDFDIGVSLHACGVATDLVLETCLRRNAAFVSCPCCYGSVQPNHMVQYPRSQTFRERLKTERQYLVLGHCADQTHEDCAKTPQGSLCMDLIDGDRCLRAREASYTVLLTKLHPVTCTPKNNLLIGLPKTRSFST